MGAEIRFEALLLAEHRTVPDRTKACILQEFIRYLDHPRSGAQGLQDMGQAWVRVRDAVSAGTLRSSDKGAAQIASRFDQLVRYVGLYLGGLLGETVTPVLPRRADPTFRRQAQLDGLCQKGALEGALRVPGTVGAVEIRADLRAQQVTCSVTVDPPGEGRPTTRLNWLLRQLKDAPDLLRVECFHANRGESRATLLREARSRPSVLLDGSEQPRLFRLTQATAMGPKRGTGRGTFITSVIDLTLRFYGEVLQNLRPWTAGPPQLAREDLDSEAEADAAGRRTQRS